MPDWFWIVALSLFGLAIGSFLNVVIYRLPAEKSLVLPASHCGSCGTPIGSYAMWNDDGAMRLRGFFASPDGVEVYHAEETTNVTTAEDANALGLRLGRELKSMIPEAVLLAVAS